MKQRALTSIQHAHPSQAALDSIVVLRRYCVNKTESGEVIHALRHLEYVYGQPIKGAVMLFRRSLSIQDDQARSTVMAEALDAIINWIFREPLKAAAWKTVLHFSRMVRNSVVSLATPLSLPGIFAKSVPVRVHHSC